jgi:hypothetical protein
MTASWRRSADAATGVIGEAAANSGASRVVGALAVRGLPHSAQNLAFGRFALPQEGQRASSAAPQAMQNLPVSGMSEWQFGHSMSAPYPTSRVHCLRVIVARQAGTEMRAGAFLGFYGSCFIGQLEFDVYLRAPVIAVVGPDSDATTIRSSHSGQCCRHQVAFGFWKKMQMGEPQLLTAVPETLRDGWMVGSVRAASFESLLWPQRRTRDRLRRSARATSGIAS